jgi:REP element-mobilizing transposase RayT
MPSAPEVPRRHSVRLKGYDYSQSGAYFVTICAQGRECLFGEVVDGGMRLNQVGLLVESSWHTLPRHFGGIILDECVVMPNHFHGIIQIVNPVGAQFIAPGFIIPEFPGLPSPSGAMNRAPTVGVIVRGFKARCTHAINQHRNTPGKPVWQRNYYERVIRNEAELAETREYIANNPRRWDLDKENPAFP